MSVCRRQKKNVKGLLFRKATDFKRCVPAPPVRAAQPPQGLHVARLARRRVARRSPRKEPARLPAEVLKLLTFSFFAKRFKLIRQFTERK